MVNINLLLSPPANGHNKQSDLQEGMATRYAANTAMSVEMWTRSTAPLIEASKDLR